MNLIARAVARYLLEDLPREERLKLQMMDASLFGAADSPTGWVLSNLRYGVLHTSYWNPGWDAIDPRSTIRAACNRAYPSSNHFNGEHIFDVQKVPGHAGFLWRVTDSFAKEHGAKSEPPTRWAHHPGSFYDEIADDLARAVLMGSPTPPDYNRFCVEEVLFGTPREPTGRFNLDSLRTWEWKKPSVWQEFFDRLSFTAAQHQYEPWALIDHVLRRQHVKNRTGKNPSTSLATENYNMKIYWTVHADLVQEHERQAKNDGKSILDGILQNRVLTKTQKRFFERKKRKAT